MASGFGKVAQALAIGIGAGMEGYGKGALQVAMNAREEYQQRLKQQWAKEESVEERGYRSEEAEKERQHDFDLLEKREEYDTAQQERTLQNQQTLARMRGSGKGGGGGSRGPSGKESAYLKRARELEEYRAKSEGREPSEAGVLAELEKLNAGRSSSAAGGAKESAYMRRAREEEELAAQVEGRAVNPENVLKNLRKATEGRTSDDTVKPTELARAMQAERAAMEDPLNRESRAFKKLSPEEQKEIVARRVIDTYEASGSKLPEEFTSRYQTGQQSKAEAPQAQAVEAPPTSTQGEKPTMETAPGSGTEADPYVANTTEQQRWVLEHAPPGAYVVVNGRVKRKPELKKAP